MMSAEKGSHAAGHAERAVVHVAAGAAGDLRQLGRREVAMHLAVELARAREGDVVDVEVEPHADRVGGDQEVDVARLIERDLGVARARAERTQHDGRAAALAPHQLGDGVDLGGRERDDRRARRQARDLLLARVGELRQARPGDEIGAGDQVGDGLAHGLGAEQQRLVAPAHVQQPVGEDVAALGVGGQLHLVDGQEVDVGLARHRLDRAHVVARPLRLDLLLARDQGNGVGADPRNDLVVDLARQQAQRQADEPRLVAQHALDGQVRLARVGRPEHGRHVANAVFEIATHSESLSASVVEAEALQSDAARSRGRANRACGASALCLAFDAAARRSNASAGHPATGGARQALLARDAGAQCSRAICGLPGVSISTRLETMVA